MDGGMNYGLLLDGLIAVLLIATIAYAAILNRQLSALRNNRIELERASRNFAEAAINADANFKMLRGTANQTGRQLQAQIDRASKLADELRLMVDVGELHARGMTSPRPAPPPTAAPTVNAEPMAPSVSAEPPTMPPDGEASATPSRPSPRERLARARRVATSGEGDTRGQPGPAAPPSTARTRRRSSARAGTNAPQAPSGDTLNAIETLR